MSPHQVVLLTSSEDPVAQLLADKLAQRTGCQVVQVGQDPLHDLYPVVEQRKLQWKDVAYMGKAGTRISSLCISEESCQRIIANHVN